MPEKTPNPTRKEIEQRCAEVQAQWTPVVRANRWTGPAPGWRTPIISTGDVQAVFLESLEPDRLAAP